MARSWIFAAITGTWLLSAGATYACGTGAEFAQPPPPKRTLTTAQQLLVRASDLESSAQVRDQQAVTFDTEADRLSNRARLLRNQAQLVSLTDREDIEDIVDELATRASVLRTRATRERNGAADLRVQARSLRNQAAQLARNTPTGGWGRRAVSL